MAYQDGWDASYWNPTMVPTNGCMMALTIAEEEVATCYSDYHTCHPFRLQSWTAWPSWNHIHRRHSTGHNNTSVSSSYFSCQAVCQTLVQTTCLHHHVHNFRNQQRVHKQKRHHHHHHHDSSNHRHHHTSDRRRQYHRFQRKSTLHVRDPQYQNIPPRTHVHLRPNHLSTLVCRRVVAPLPYQGCAAPCTDSPRYNFEHLLNHGHDASLLSSDFPSFRLIFHLL
mmetsp:Transcript_41307/g.86713  ORF Transcript_41307/g.86713 Transcript_41307/m.86713 type:complete len:224 (+) Transcript_41307:1447-2118(+)